MTARHELYYDTEAALRLVDSELDELRGDEEARDAGDALVVPSPSAVITIPGDSDAARHLRALLGQPAGEPVGLASLPFILDRANAEIRAVLEALRESREALEVATRSTLQATSEKLKEVTSVTEVAATDILDGLERAQELLDDLDAADATDDRARGRHVRDLLREEVFGMMGCLQFQDITTQQLAYAASVLTDMEERLGQIARLFDPAAVIVRAAIVPPAAQAFDPHATTRDADRRQALVDEIFTATR